jgi:hypothetical protein
MITINYRGRLGNNLIQYAAGAILAEKTGMCLKTKPESRNNNFGEAFSLQPIDGVCYDKTIELNDKNYYDHLNNPEPNIGYILNGFFQDSKLLCDFRDQILDLYKLPEPKESVSSDDVFIACRLGDCLKGPRTYCTMEYIENQLKASRHKYDKAYVTSDTITHPPLKRLIEEYNLTVYQDEPMDTILFGAQFNNLILSAGSFSYLMAYFSKADNVTVYRSKQDPLQEHGGWNYNNKVKLI